MDCIPCLPTFINPIAMTMFLIKDRQWHAGSGTELWLRNPACKVAGPTLTRTVTLDKWRSKSQSSCLWGFFKRNNYDFSFLWAQSEHRAWRVLGVKCVLLTSGQQCTKQVTCINSGDLFRDECWYVCSLIFISMVLCSAFFICSWKKEKKTDIKEEAKNDAQDWRLQHEPFM